MLFTGFLSVIVADITVFFLIKGQPNLFMFELIDRLFGEKGKEGKICNENLTNL